jgi:hypothetical protein
MTPSITVAATKTSATVSRLGRAVARRLSDHDSEASAADLTIG